MPIAWRSRSLKWSENRELTVGAAAPPGIRQDHPATPSGTERSPSARLAKKLPRGFVRSELRGRCGFWKSDAGLLGAGSRHNRTAIIVDYPAARATRGRRIGLRHVEGRRGTQQKFVFGAGSRR